MSVKHGNKRKEVVSSREKFVICELVKLKEVYQIYNMIPHSRCTRLLCRLILSAGQAYLISQGLITLFLQYSPRTNVTAFFIKPQLSDFTAPSQSHSRQRKPCRSQVSGDVHIPPAPVCFILFHAVGYT
jgi:hypothetical protein